jgi:hypothetical protein
MDQVKPRLEAFAAEMLGGLARSDQRAKGELYVRGLLVDGKRKSIATSFMPGPFHSAIPPPCPTAPSTPGR